MSKGDSLRRRPAFRSPQARFLIVCEGTRTEPGYFRQKCHLDRSLVELELSRGGVPKTLVERAVEMKTAAKRDAKSKKDRNLDYDEVWCVFDIDEHPFVPEAKQQARDNRINTAISNPCFELWILPHFQDQRAYIERTHVQRECRRYLPNYEKDVPTVELLPRDGEAVARARGPRRMAGIERWRGREPLDWRVPLDGEDQGSGAPAGLTIGIRLLACIGGRWEGRGSKAPFAFNGGAFEGCLRRP